MGWDEGETDGMGWDGMRERLMEWQGMGWDEGETDGMVRDGMRERLMGW